MKSNFSLPASAGISLKPEYFNDVPQVIVEGLWFEVHAENYLIDGGPRLAALKEIAARYPLSVHGVGASLAGPEPVDKGHLQRLKQLCNNLKVASFSEHLAWSTTDSHYFNNLLPIPLTKQTLHTVSNNVMQIQDALQRTIAIENPANYIHLNSDINEAEFLMELSHKTQCSLLLDVNNLFVSAQNVGLQPNNYIDTLDLDVVSEIHIAGHSSDPLQADLLIDSHDSPVAPEVWELLQYVLQQAGPKPVLIERDSDLPAFSELMLERKMAADLIQHCSVISK